jgi:hypothetical protein
VFDVTTNTWLNVDVQGTAPSARILYASVNMDSRDILYVIGGAGGTNNTGGTYAFQYECEFLCICVFL